MNFVQLCEDILTELETLEEASSYQLSRLSRAARTSMNKLTKAITNRDLSSAIQAKEELVKSRQEFMKEMEPTIYSTNAGPLTEDDADKKIDNLSRSYDLLPLHTRVISTIDKQVE